MEESIDIPELDAVQDLNTAKFLLKHLVAAADGQAKTIEQLTETIELLRHEIADLKRALFGQKSERVIPVDREIGARLVVQGSALGVTRRRSTEGSICGLGHTSTRTVSEYPQQSESSPIEPSPLKGTRLI